MAIAVAKLLCDARDESVETGVGLAVNVAVDVLVAVRLEVAVKVGRSASATSDRPPDAWKTST